MCYVSVNIFTRRGGLVWVVVVGCFVDFGCVDETNYWRSWSYEQCEVIQNVFLETVS